MKPPALTMVDGVVVDLYAIARDPAASVETRRAAADALVSLERLDTCLRLDRGAPTVNVVILDCDVRRTWRAK